MFLEFCDRLEYKEPVVFFRGERLQLVDEFCGWILFGLFQELVNSRELFSVFKSIVLDVRVPLFVYSFAIDFLVVIDDEHTV